MRYLSVGEILEIHGRVLVQSGGSSGIRDLGMLESAAAQPLMTFGGEDLYPTMPEKATAIAFSLIKNHPFVDANKRVGHAAMETFLVLNGYELDVPVDEQERVMLEVAAGSMARDELTEWVRAHLLPRPQP